jgi:ribosome-binding factor A
LRQPSLARNLIFRAREISADVTGLVRKKIADAMRLRFWSGVNGVSSDLEQARTLVARCVTTENDPELKQDFEQTLGQIQDQIARDLRWHQEGEDP